MDDSSLANQFNLILSSYTDCFLVFVVPWSYGVEAV